MYQYQQLLETILDEGSICQARNGNTVNIFGHAMTFYMEDGFPIPTVKRTYWKTALKEMQGFLQGFTSAKQFRSLNVGIWDGNANEEPSWLANPYRTGEDDLGPIYGAQWRGWPGYKTIPITNQEAIDQATANGYRYITRFLNEDGVKVVLLYKKIDQLMEALNAIHKTPTSRRIIFHAWNPAVLDEVALPPCHLLYQFGVDVPRKRLSLNMYIRSNDIGLGAPFNIVESAFLLHLFAHLTGYEAYKLTYMIGDAHLYENQIDMAKVMIQRKPYHLPTLKISDRIPKYADTGIFDPSWLTKWTIDDFDLENYQHHGELSAKMIA